MFQALSASLSAEEVEPAQHNKQLFTCDWQKGGHAIDRQALHRHKSVLQALLHLGILNKETLKAGLRKWDNATGRNFAALEKDDKHSISNQATVLKN